MRKWVITGILLLCHISIVWTQDIATKLVVIDEQLQPLAGASIIGYPGEWLIITNAKGQANIPQADSVLVTYLGLQTATFYWEEIISLNGQLSLKASAAALPTVTVTDKVGQRDLSQAKLTVSALSIQRAQVSTAADALAAEAGVFVQMSQLGGGSPIIRGFEANRVLLLVDDIRMNNAIYRSGHLQNAITVDENILASINVSFGPGSLPYGSDALGGVVHFKSKNPLPLANLPQKTIRWSGQAGWRYASAANSNTLSANLNYQAQNWSGISAVSIARFNDLRAGDKRPSNYPDFGLRQEYVQSINGIDSVIQNDQPNRQIASGYEQLDLLQKFNFNLAQDWRLQVNFQYSTSGDVPRYDRLTQRRNGQLRFAEWYYGPQQRVLLAGKLYWQSQKPWADDARLIFSRQWIAEDRYDRSLDSEWREANLVDVIANNLTLDFTKRWSKQHLINYGLDSRHDNVASEAFRLSVFTDERIDDVNSRYPSQGSQLSSIGAYIQYRYTNPDSSLLLESGGRINQQQLQVQFGNNDPIEWPMAYLDGITGNSTAATWASGISWQKKKWAIRTHLATGFRTPNVDDFAKFRERNGFIQIPNPNLQAEQSLSADISLGRWLGKRAKISITAYRTWLRNAIVRENFSLPNGNDFFLNRGDTLFVQANVNAEQARIWGIDFAIDYKLSDQLTAKAQYHYTYGRRDYSLNNTTIEVPLDHIPPTYGQVDLLYTNDPWEASLHWQFQAQKKLIDYAVANIAEDNGKLILDRSGTPDNLEQTPLNATDQTYAGSYAWSVFHLRASFRISKQLRLRAQLNNIFDLHYRPFASGISAAGREVVVGVYGYF